MYVHVPWCRARCPYCAFAVEPGQAPPDWPPFVARVLSERAARVDAFDPAGKPVSVYLGGGTPSRLPAEAVAALIRGIEPAPGAEITIEVNPEDVRPGWLDAVVDAGVDRVSLGVQSTIAEVARRLGRGHTQARAADAMTAVSRAGLRSWSADLMFGAPDQTLDALDRDLDALVAAGAPHVSVYGLTIEPGTRFASALEAGRAAVAPADDDLWRQMYDRIVDRLGAAGLERYEVSNFARPGHASLHNRGYWSDRPYLGLGPSAHGYAPDGARWVNQAALADYLASDDPTASSERPSDRARATDALVSGMRAVEGVDLDRLRARTGLGPDPAVVARLVAGGAVEARGARLALTHAGFPIADAVIRRLVDGLAEAPGPAPRDRR